MKTPLELFLDGIEPRNTGCFWVASALNRYVEDYIIYGPYKTMQEAKAKRQYLKLNNEPHNMVSLPFYAQTIEEAESKVRLRYLWP